MNYALQNQVRSQFARELDAIGRRSRSKLHDPRAAMLIPRPFTIEERRARAEYAETVVANVRALRGPGWHRGELEQWIERVWCMSVGFAEGAAAAIPLGPVDVMGGSTTNIVGYLQGELGVSIGTGVSAWASQYGGTTLDLTQGTASAQPLHTANDATIWGRSTVTGDGSNDNLFSAWDPPAPGTTPTCFRFVGQWVANAVGRRVFGGGANMIIFRSNAGVSTNMEVTNGTASGAVAMAAGTWFRGLAHFGNSTSDDEFQIGSNTTGIGTAWGNTNPTSWGILAVAAGTSAANFAFQKILALNVKPSALQRAIFDGIDLAFYNSNITV